MHEMTSAFISYSWDSEAHKLWVRELATRLRTSGVDITLDQWHLAPGDQLPQFMESAVRDSDFVLESFALPATRPDRTTEQAASAMRVTS